MKLNLVLKIILNIIIVFKGCDELFNHFRQLAYNKQCCSKEELRIIFNDISKSNTLFLKNIQDFFTNNENIDQSQIVRFKRSFGRNISSLSVLLTRLLEDTEKLPLMIINNIQILSRLTNGNSFNSYILNNGKL